MTCRRYPNYTYKKDIYGKEIKEGDIVRFLVQEYLASGIVRYDNSVCKFFIETPGYNFLDFEPNGEYEVIGRENERDKI